MKGGIDGKLPLTENQARILAPWWGCGYARLEAAPGENGGVLPGVVVAGPLNEGQEPSRTGPVSVAFLEEAQALEHLRHFDNHDHALDWDW
jgi:hypothetical protein